MDTNGICSVCSNCAPKKGALVIGGPNSEEYSGSSCIAGSTNSRITWRAKLGISDSFGLIWCLHFHAPESFCLFVHQLISKLNIHDAWLNKGQENSKQTETWKPVRYSKSRFLHQQVKKLGCPNDIQWFHKLSCVCVYYIYIYTVYTHLTCTYILVLFIRVATASSKKTSKSWMLTCFRVLSALLNLWYPQYFSWILAAVVKDLTKALNLSLERLRPWRPANLETSLVRPSKSLTWKSLKALIWKDLAFAWNV